MEGVLQEEARKEVGGGDNAVSKMLAGHAYGPSLTPSNRVREQGMAVHDCNASTGEGEK